MVGLARGQVTWSPPRVYGCIPQSAEPRTRHSSLCRPGLWHLVHRRQAPACAQVPADSTDRYRRPRRA